MQVLGFFCLSVYIYVNSWNGWVKLKLCWLYGFFSRMDMVISAGKSLKNVDAYVIMPSDAKSAVTLLNRTRHEVGVSTSNPYIFARLNSDSPLSVNSDLKQIVAECPGLQHQERITSTGLRRYIATVTQVSSKIFYRKDHFSAPLSWKFTGELIVLVVLYSISSTIYKQPLGESSSNFMWTFHSMGEKKVCLNGSRSHDQDGYHVHGKKLKKSFIPEPKGQ